MQILRLHLLNHPTHVVLVRPQGLLWLYEFAAAYLRGYKPHRLLFSRSIWMKKEFPLRGRQVD